MVKTGPYLHVSNLTRRLPRADQRTVTLIFLDWVDPVGINVSELNNLPLRALGSIKRGAYYLLYPM